jgi:pyroglutamyl-peptidase
MRVLVTAFEPYGPWQTNSSWLTLVELTRDLPSQPSITTRLYPVDFDRVRGRVEGDLAHGYDYLVFTGQAPGRPRIELETVALNLACQNPEQQQAARPLISDGPLAYATELPAERICQRMRQAGIPAAVSRDAGTYLCNAVLYFALHQVATLGLASRAIFVHLPLDPSQVALYDEPLASMPAAVSAMGLRILFDALTPPRELA